MTVGKPNSSRSRASENYQDRAVMKTLPDANGPLFRNLNGCQNHGNIRKTRWYDLKNSKLTCRSSRKSETPVSHPLFKRRASTRRPPLFTETRDADVSSPERNFRTCTD